MRSEEPPNVGRRPALRRAAALGGLVGPAAFAGAWTLGGAIRRGYSPVQDAISQLAAVRTSTRPLMSAGFVCFGLAVPPYGLALRDALPGPAWAAAVTTGVATLGVAAFPLGRSPTGDAVHGCWAVAGYLSLAATPLLASRALARAGRRRAAAASVVAGTASALCLAATVFGPAHGFWQRTGLTVGDVWLAASAVVMLRGDGDAAGRCDPPATGGPAGP